MELQIIIHYLKQLLYLPFNKKKTTGFINFDLQLFRPELPKSNAHDKRFEPFNYFPKNLSDNKPIQQVDFNKMKDRDNSIYKNVSCSDSLYDHKKHLDLFHPKNAGID